MLFVRVIIIYLRYMVKFYTYIYYIHYETNLPNTGFRMVLHRPVCTRCRWFYRLTRCRAIAGRTARCRCKFRYVSNLTTASCGFHTHFLLVFVCRLQRIIWQKVISTRKNQSDRNLTQTSNQASLSITTVIIIYRNVV